MRRLSLRTQYAFSCDCSRCEGQTPGRGDIDALMEALVDGDGAADGQAASVIAESERALSRASQSIDPEQAATLTKMALRMRRAVCHPLSLHRYHAEHAMCALAISRSEDALARECGHHVLAFLEMALAHVPWHPSLSIERMQQACTEATLGRRKDATQLMVRAVDALETTHGKEHALTQRAIMVREALKRAPDVAKVGSMLRPWTSAASRVRKPTTT